MPDIETRIAALHERLEKYNPYHAKDGKFTGSQGAHFVSTTNAKTTARMKQAHADQKAKEEAAKPKGPTLEGRAKQMVEDGVSKLPKLEGSEKQVAWAEKIRADAIIGKSSPGLGAKKFGDFVFDGGSVNGMELGMRKHMEKLADDKEYTASAEQTLKAIDALRAEKSAKWWIDHKILGASGLIKAKGGSLNALMGITKKP